MQSSTPLEPVVVEDEDLEEVTRKRARIEARRKFRIITSTIVACRKFQDKACDRFRFVLEVDAEKPEQAESEMLALKNSLESLSVQPLSEESVHTRTTRRQELSYPGVEVEMVTPLNVRNAGSVSRQGYPMIEREKIDPVEQAAGNMITLPDAIDYGSLFIADQGQFTTEEEESALHEQAERKLITPPYATDHGTFCIPNQGYSPRERQGSGPYEQAEDDKITLPRAIDLSVPNQEHNTVERGEAVPYGQELWKFLNGPDLTTHEGLGNSEPEEGGLEDSSWADLEKLWTRDRNTEHWAMLASEMNDAITQKILDLESGAGRAKVQKLHKDAEEIAKKIGTLGSTSEGKKFPKMQASAKATSTTLPTIRDVGQYLTELFEKLKSYVNELTNNTHGRQKQVSSLTAMARLIEDGRKTMINFGRGTDWISDKLTNLQRDLKFRELIVEKHFQKCAEVIPARVQSFMKDQRGNFISVASLIDWYFEVKSVG